MKLKRALVTGATGFIGSRLCVNCTRLADRQFVVRDKSRNGVAGLPGIAFGMMGRPKAWRVSSPMRVRRRVHLASLYLAMHRPGDVEARAGAIFFWAHSLDAMAAHQFLISSIPARGFSIIAMPITTLNLYAATKQAFQDMVTYVEARARAVTLQLCDSYGLRIQAKIWNPCRRHQGH